MTHRNSYKDVENKLVALGKTIKNRRDNSFMAQCPAHDDNGPSLSVKWDNGRTLLHCFAGCQTHQITDALSMQISDLFDDRKDLSAKAIYDYKNRQGKTTYLKAKHIPAGGKKSFTYHLPDGTKCENGNSPAKTIYRQESLPKKGQVFLLESEKGADDLTCLGLKAVAVGGANMWQREFTPLFKGLDVVLIPHLDSGGETLTQNIVTDILAIARSVKIVDLDNLPPKGDVSDWLATGGDLDGLELRVRNSKVLEVPELIDAEPVDITLQSMADVEDKPLTWFWEDKIPDHGVSMLQGDPGAGKSFLSIMIASHISNGTPWPDCPEMPVEKGCVLIITGEDAPARVKERLVWAGADLKKVFILSGETHLDIRLHLAKIQQLIINMPMKCRLVIFDPITAYMGNTKANDNNAVRSTLEPLGKFADENELCILNITHMNKKADDKRIYRGLGSIGFTAVVRSTWTVEFDPNDEEHETRIFSPTKTNYSRYPSGLKYRIEDNQVQFESEPFFGNMDTLEVKASEDKQGKAGVVADWLRDRLQGCAVAQATIAKELHDEFGTTKGTLWRAKKMVGIKSTKGDSYDGGWAWELEDSENV